MIPQRLTAKAYTAHLDRGPCGHILCAGSPACAQTQTSGPERAPGAATTRGKTGIAAGSEPGRSGPGTDHQTTDETQEAS